MMGGGEAGERLSSIRLWAEEEEEEEKDGVGSRNRGGRSGERCRYLHGLI